MIIQVSSDRGKNWQDIQCAKVMRGWAKTGGTTSCVVIHGVLPSVDVPETVTPEMAEANPDKIVETVWARTNDDGKLTPLQPLVAAVYYVEIDKRRTLVLDGRAIPQVL